MSAAEALHESAQMVSFSPFVNLTRQYADALCKLAPKAADMIHSSSVHWHAEWDAIVSPNGEYAALDQVAALRQFDRMESYGEAICDVVRCFYSGSETEAIRAAFANSLRKHRALYFSEHSALRQEFVAFADKMNILLDNAFAGVITQSEALVEIERMNADAATRYGG